MQRLVLGRGAVDLAQELQPFRVTMARLALGDDLAVEHVERGEQRGRAVALVVMGHGRRPAFLQRQPRLGAIQRLDMAVNRTMRALRGSSARSASVETIGGATRLGNLQSDSHCVVGVMAYQRVPPGKKRYARCPRANP
jgi:hypothetical protein